MTPDWLGGRRVGGLEVIGRAARSRRTLGNSAAISVTATQIFSEQGRKLRGKKKNESGEAGDGGDQITSANIALEVWGRRVPALFIQPSQLIVVLCCFVPQRIVLGQRQTT